MLDDFLIVDVSQNQDHSLPWREWFDTANVRAAILRQSTGLRMDTMFETHFREARAAYLWTMEYHHIMPGADPVQQAIFFAQHHPRGWRGPAFVDVETEGVTRPALKAFIETYYQVARRELFIYTRATAWAELMGKGAVEFAKHHLWVAAYGPGVLGTNAPWTDEPPLPDIWSAWDFWQFAGDNGRLPPYAGKIDLSVYQLGWLELGALYYSFGDGPMDDSEIAALKAVYDDLTSAQMQTSAALSKFGKILAPKPPPPPPLTWWERLPTGVFAAPIAYPPQTTPYNIYGPDGKPLAVKPRTNAGQLYERQGDLLRVTVTPPVSGLPNWWVKAGELLAHPA